MARTAQRRRNPVYQTNNPWYYEARERVFQFSDGSWYEELALVNNEYADHISDDDWRWCGNDHKAYYRSTVGAYQCPTCRELAWTGFIPEEKRYLTRPEIETRVKQLPLVLHPDILERGYRQYRSMWLNAEPNPPKEK